MALLKCDPAVIQEKSEMLPTIPGEIPDLVDLPQGCIFASRCPEVGEICLEGPPPMVEVSPGHLAACVRRTEGEMA
jgi:oligopeptide/dipeptide ABC transporter ATP-binding protein